MLAEFIILHGKVIISHLRIRCFCGRVAVERVFANRLRWSNRDCSSLSSRPARYLPPGGAILPPGKLVADMRAIGLQLPRTETSHTAPRHRFSPINLAGGNGSSVGHVYNHLRPEIRNALRSSAKTTARLERSISLVHWVATGNFRASNYFLWGPRDWTGEVALVLDTRTTMSAGNLPQSRIWAKS
jgi:hypothetical protein